MSNFETIWDMQLDLNKVVGRDTVNDPNKKSWIYDYAQALEDELMELKNCVNWKWWSKESKELGQYTTIIDPKNAKIEVIDILHFTMSLLHIVDIKDLDFFQTDCYVPNEYPKAPSLFWICERMHDTIRLIKRSTNWESECDMSGRLIPLQTPCRLVKSLFLDLNQLFWVLDMNIVEILDIYKLKHEKNMLRQENNYSVINKTEDDNNEIKAKI